MKKLLYGCLCTLGAASASDNVTLWSAPNIEINGEEAEVRGVTNWVQEGTVLTSHLELTIEAVKSDGTTSYPAPYPASMKLLLILDSSYAGGKASESFFMEVVNS